MTLVNHDPGPEHHQVGRHDRVHRLPGGRRVPRQQPHPSHLAHGGGDGHLAADHPAHPRIRFQARNIGLDPQSHRAHRQHPAMDAEDAAQLVERRHRIGQHLVETGQNQVADRVARQRAAATEPVLDDRRPQPAVRAVRCQRRQRHSQITRRHHIQLAAQPTRRSAVVGDRDHRGDVRGEPAGGRQRGVQPVPATERDDPCTHSRPRSRCSTRTVSDAPPSSRAASASAIATLRCLPPVQPMATVM